MCFTFPLRIPNGGGVITYSEKHHRPVTEKYAAEIYDRKHAPLGLVGDNAADQLLVVLLDRAKRNLDQLERTTNARIHALWQLTYRGRRLLSTHAFKWNVERTVEMFEEKKGWIYDKLVWEHGRKSASQVFDMLKARERLPRDYLRLLAEWGSFPPRASAYELTKMVVDHEDWEMVSRNGDVTTSHGTVNERVDKGKSRWVKPVNRVEGNVNAGTQVEWGDGCDCRTPVNRWKEEEGECSYRPWSRASSDDNFSVESDVIDRDSDDSSEGAVVISLRERWA